MPTDADICRVLEELRRLARLVHLCGLLLAQKDEINRERLQTTATRARFTESWVHPRSATITGTDRQEVIKHWGAAVDEQHRLIREYAVMREWFDYICTHHTRHSRQLRFGANGRRCRQCPERGSIALSVRDLVDSGLLAPNARLEGHYEDDRGRLTGQVHPDGTITAMIGATPIGGTWGGRHFERVLPAEDDPSPRTLDDLRQRFKRSGPVWVPDDSPTHTGA